MATSSRSPKSSPSIKPLGGGPTKKSVPTISKPKLRTKPNIDADPTPSIGVAQRYRGIDGLVFGVFVLILAPRVGTQYRGPYH
jgi:hypothetical protein